MTSYAAMPAQYVVQQPVTYFTQPEVTYGAMPAEGQMFYEAAPVQYVQPALYSISAERFAQIAAGIPLTQEEIEAMTGGVTVEAASAAVAAPVAVQSAVEPAPLVKSEKKEKSSSKKKSLKGSKKKKSKGCC